MVRRALLSFTGILTLLISTPLIAAAQNGGRSGALTLIEAGFAADGVTPRYSLEANGADLREVLAALLKKTGKEYVIDQDVTGPVSLVLRDKTLDEILQRLAQLARPPILIRSGETITVHLAPEVPASPEDKPRKPAEPGLAAIRTRYAPVVPSQTLTLGQPVTLAIPEDRPVALRAVLVQVERQTGVPLRLDPRVPADVAVAARFTDTPLSLVLDSIARTGALKWQLQRDGSVLIAPTDVLVLSLRGVQAFSSVAVCPSCGRSVLPGWKFCPHDGTPLTVRGQGQSPRRP